MNRSVSIIVPAYNEGGNIGAAIDGVFRVADRAGLERFEVIVVDDGSTDATPEAIKAAIWRHHAIVADGRVHMREHEANLGLRAAYETGLAAARYEYVTWVPGDGEMATESIAAILKAIGTADLVVPYHGTPHKRPWLRRLLTWGSTLQMNMLLGRHLRYWNGPVVYPTEMARRLPRTVPGFFSMAESLAWALEEGCTYVQVPLTHQERQYGVSKAVGWSKVWAAQLLILKLAYRIWSHRLAAEDEAAFPIHERSH